MDLYEELRSLVRALARAEIDYALRGGVALAFHGHPRFTKDIDLLVEASDVDRLGSAVAKLGFDLPAAPITFDAGTTIERVVHRISKAEGAELLTLDALVVTPALRRAFDSRERFRWTGGEITVVSAAALADMKRLAGRPQDLVDADLLDNAGGAP